MTFASKSAPLKAAFISAILGDIAMALTGLAGMANWVGSAGVGDFTFIIGGLAAAVGHTALMLRKESGPAGILLVTFIVAGLCYAVSGFGLDNYAFVISGLLVVGAALIGWLIPSDGGFAGTSKAQAASGLLVISTLLTYVAGVQCDNVMLIFAAVLFTACNIAHFIARKNG